MVEALLARGTEVIGLDNFDPYYPRAFKEANLAVARTDPRFTFAEADITDAGAVAALPPFGAVIHLAAKAGVRPSIANSLAYQQVNLIGTQLVLDACRARGVDHVVFGSSSSVYGLNPAYPWSEADQRLAPISPYASSKLSAEMLGATYAHLFGIRFIALRYFTVFGPRQRPDLAINSFVDRIMAGQPLTRYGSGDTLRDYTYVSDIVAGDARGPRLPAHELRADQPRRGSAHESPGTHRRYRASRGSERHHRGSPRATGRFARHPRRYQ